MASGDKKLHTKRTVDVFDDKDEPTVFINPPPGSRGEYHYKHDTNSYLGKILIWDEQDW